MLHQLAIVAVATSSLLASVAASSAETLYVCDGCEFYSIQEAIDYSSNGDVIQLEWETYREGRQIDTLGKAITIRGRPSSGFPGSVIDGQGLHRLIRCQSGEQLDTIFEHLVFTNGVATQAETEEKYVTGGGMLLVDSSPTIRNCRFEGNEAFEEGWDGGAAGGALSCQGDSSPAILDCYFGYNAALYAGAIAANGPLAIAGSVFEANHGGYGGGAIGGGSLTLANCSFTANTAEWGGAIQGAIESATQCVFDGNTAEDFGGVASVNNETVRFFDCVFRNNTARWVGGIFRNPWGAGSVYIEGCSFCANGPRPVFAPWTGSGNCFAYSCQDSNGNGRPDECDGAAPVTRHVPADYSTIEEAIASAKPGDTIEIAAGTYVVQETLASYGKELVIRGVTDEQGHPLSIIDGKGEVPIFEYSTHSGGPAQLENLSFHNGLGASNSGFLQGGAITCHWGSLVIKNCEFAGNVSGYGAGVLAYFSDVVMEGCDFTGNTAATGDGGGAYLYRSNGVVTSCAFFGNHAWFNGGGGLMFYNNSSSTYTAHVSNCEFVANTSSYLGGALISNGVYLNLSGCHFEENAAERPGGAAVITAPYPNEPPVLIEVSGCNFVNNTAPAAADLYIRDAKENYALSNCTFAECCGVVPPRNFIDLGGNDYESWCDDCRADVDCLGNEVNANDLGYLLLRWDTSDPQCDLDGDGVVTASDLGFLFAAWGPCS